MVMVVVAAGGCNGSGRNSCATTNSKTGATRKIRARTRGGIGEWRHSRESFWESFPGSVPGAFLKRSWSVPEVFLKFSQNRPPLSVPSLVRALMKRPPSLPPLVNGDTRMRPVMRNNRLGCIAIIKDFGSSKEFSMQTNCYAEHPSRKKWSHPSAQQSFGMRCPHSGLRFVESPNCGRPIPYTLTTSRKKVNPIKIIMILHPV